MSLLAESQRNRHTSFGPADPLGPSSAGHVADHGPAHTLSHPWLSVPPAAVRYDAAKEERQQQEAKQRELQRVEEALQAAARRGKTTPPSPYTQHGAGDGGATRGWMDGGGSDRASLWTNPCCVCVCVCILHMLLLPAASQTEDLLFSLETVVYKDPQSHNGNTM